MYSVHLDLTKANEWIEKMLHTDGIEHHLMVDNAE
jgi:hypothetical protein